MALVVIVNRRLTIALPNLFGQHLQVIERMRLGVRCSAGPVGRCIRWRRLGSRGLSRSLAGAALIGARFVADDAAAAIERDSAALVQCRAQVQARTLDPALHSGHREPKPIGGLHLGNALELDEL